MPIRRADQRAEGYELPTHENSKTHQFFWRRSNGSWSAREPWGEAKYSIWHSGRASQIGIPAVNGWFATTKRPILWRSSRINICHVGLPSCSRVGLAQYAPHAQKVCGLHKKDTVRIQGP